MNINTEILVLDIEDELWIDLGDVMLLAEDVHRTKYWLPKSQATEMYGPFRPLLTDVQSYIDWYGWK